MVARLLMSVHVTYLLPSNRVPLWRDAWEHAAQAAGWTVVHHWDAAQPSIDADVNTLILIVGPMSGGPPANCWTIVAPEAASVVIDAIHTQLKSDRVIAVGHAMHCFASAAELVAAGADLVRTSDQLAKSPFGDVVVSSVMPAEPSSEPWPLYDRLPIVENVEFQLPLELFKVPTKTAMEGGCQPIDLTGKGRIIFHGPYVELPSGEWSVEVLFRYEGQGKSAPLRFEWGVGNDVDCVDVVVKNPGEYSLTLSHVWECLDACQLRVWLYHAVFIGFFEVVGVKIKRGSRPILASSVA